MNIAKAFIIFLAAYFLGLIVTKIFAWIICTIIGAIVGGVAYFLYESWKTWDHFFTK